MTDTNEHQTPESTDGGNEGIDVTPENTEAVAPVAEADGAILAATTDEPAADEPAAGTETESVDSEAAVAVAMPCAGELGRVECA